MFNNNSYKGGITTTNINAVTGAILKNHPKSWFEFLNLNGKRANRLLTEGGDTGKRQEYPNQDNWLYKPVTVLQMVICGDMQVIAECVYTEDLEQPEVVGMGIEKQVELVNNIIFNSIMHGADPGGSYDCNEEGLYRSIENWLKTNNITGYTIGEVDIPYNGSTWPGVVQLVKGV